VRRIYRCNGNRLCAQNHEFPFQLGETERPEEEEMKKFYGEKLSCIGKTTFLIAIFKHSV